MTFQLHQVSNPYFSNVRVLENGEIIVEQAVDQLWVNPDTNEEEIITEYFQENEESL